MQTDRRIARTNIARTNAVLSRSRAVRASPKQRRQERPAARRAPSCPITHHKTRSHVARERLHRAIPNYCLASPTPTRLAAGGAHCHQRVAAPAVCLLPGHSAALHSVLGRRVASALALLPPRSLPRQRPAPTFRTLDGGNLPCGEGLDRLLLLGRLGPIQRCPACVVALSQVRSNPEQR